MLFYVAPLMQWCCPESSNKIRVEILRSILIKIKLSSTTKTEKNSLITIKYSKCTICVLVFGVFFFKKKRKAVMNTALHLYTCLQSRVYGNIVQHGHACCMSTKKKKKFHFKSCSFFTYLVLLRPCHRQPHLQALEEM